MAKITANSKALIRPTYLGLTALTGQALGSLTYNTSTYLYNYSCEPIIDSSTCPNGKVKSITPTGKVDCLNPAGLIDSSTTTVKKGSTCRLALHSGKLKLDCAGAGSPTITKYQCTDSGWSAVDTTSCGSEGVLCGSTAVKADIGDKICCET